MALPTIWLWTSASRTLREYISVILSHQACIICYDSLKKLIRSVSSSVKWKDWDHTDKDIPDL